MKSRLIILLLLFIFNTLTVRAQTVIKIPFIQPERFIVQPKVVYKSMEGSESIEIGSDTEIIGGSGKYSFTWLKNGLTIGSGPTLSITEKGEYMLTINDGVNCQASTSYLIDSPISGINDLDRADFDIYPNPTGGKLTIQFSASQKLNRVEIYNIEGKLLHSYPVDKTKMNELGIDASGLPAGQYLLVTHFELKKITKVLVIR